MVKHNVSLMPYQCEMLVRYWVIIVGSVLYCKKNNWQVYSAVFCSSEFDSSAPWNQVVHITLLRITPVNLTKDPGVILCSYSLSCNGLPFDMWDFHRIFTQSVHGYRRYCLTTASTSDSVVNAHFVCLANICCCHKSAFVIFDTSYIFYKRTVANFVMWRVYDDCLDDR